MSTNPRQNRRRKLRARRRMGEYRTRRVRHAQRMLRAIFRDMWVEEARGRAYVWFTAESDLEPGDAVVRTQSGGVRRA